MRIQRGGAGAQVHVDRVQLYLDPQKRWRLRFVHDGVGGATTTVVEMSRAELGALVSELVRELTRDR